MPGDLYVPYLSRTIPGQTLRHLKWFVNVETIFDNLDLTVISIPLPQVIDSGWGLCKPLRTASHQLQNDSLHRDCVGQAHLQGFLLELGTGYWVPLVLSFHALGRSRTLFVTSCVRCVRMGRWSRQAFERMVGLTQPAQQNSKLNLMLCHIISFQFHGTYSHSRNPVDNNWWCFHIAFRCFPWLWQCCPWAMKQAFKMASFGASRFTSRTGTAAQWRCTAHLIWMPYFGSFFTSFLSVSRVIPSAVTCYCHAKIPSMLQHSFSDGPQMKATVYSEDMKKHDFREAHKTVHAAVILLLDWNVLAEKPPVC